MLLARTCPLVVRAFAGRGGAAIWRAHLGCCWLLAALAPTHHSCTLEAERSGPQGLAATGPLILDLPTVPTVPIAAASVLAPGSGFAALIDSTRLSNQRGFPAESPLFPSPPVSRNH